MRTESVTLDASCLAKLFLEEPDSPAFRRWYQAMRACGAAFQAPALIQYELGNILRREFRDAPAELKGRILGEALEGVEMVQVDAAQPFLLAADLTYYDAAYACDALATGALATDDARLAAIGQRQGSTVLVWSPKAMQAATDPGFVPWLKRQRKGTAIGDVAQDLRMDPSSAGVETFLQAWDHFRRVGASEAALRALDMAFERFGEGR